MIAFHSDRTGNFDIWVIPAGGGVPLQVTTTTSEDMNPVWSPNGTEIAYDSFTGSGWKDIWAIGLGGGTPRRITTQTGEDADPDWSPDGQTIVYTRIPVPNPTTSAELWRIPAGGGVPSPVLADPNAFDQDPVWSPDGAQVLFQSSRNNNSDLWVAPASGGPLTRATTDAAWDWHPAWSKDEAIVFSSNRAGNFDIWVLPSIQDVPVQITTDPGSDGSPAWSPDGTMIAFSSDPSGNFDIWVVPYPTTAVEARSWGALKALYRE
jgi:Tol biopolymer transport system component